MDVEPPETAGGGQYGGSLYGPSYGNKHHGFSFFFALDIALRHYHSESDEHIPSRSSSAPEGFAKHLMAIDMITTYKTTMAAAKNIPISIILLCSLVFVIS